MVRKKIDENSLNCSSKLIKSLPIFKNKSGQKPKKSGQNANFVRQLEPLIAKKVLFAQKKWATAHF